MGLRHRLLTLLFAGAALALAGCFEPDESATDFEPEAIDDDGVCAPGAHLEGESGHPPGTTGSGRGDITTADGGDPSRPTSAPSAADYCGPRPGYQGDHASTGLGEPGGGRSTEPE